MVVLPRTCPQLRRIATPALVATAAAALAGCGSGGAAIEATTGPEIFEQANCASCHTLAEAGATGVTGPNLDKRQADKATIEAKVKGGAAGMPSFGKRLTDEQIALLADYVIEARATR